MVLMSLMVVFLMACSSNEVAPAADSCPAATGDMGQLTDETNGFCLLFPNQYASGAVGDDELVLYVESLMNVTEPRLYLNIEDAAGRTADQVADELLAVYSLPDWDVARSTVTVDGETAVVLDNMPGQDIGRWVVVVHNDRAYRFTFVPTGADYGDVAAETEALYTAVINSFNFKS
jgi:hypothetical protein